jgi:hypothetical protein
MAIEVAGTSPAMTALGNGSIWRTAVEAVPYDPHDRNLQF